MLFCLSLVSSVIKQVTFETSHASCNDLKNLDKQFVSLCMLYPNAHVGNMTSPMLLLLLREFVHTFTAILGLLLRLAVEIPP